MTTLQDACRQTKGETTSIGFICRQELEESATQQHHLLLCGGWVESRKDLFGRRARYEALLRIAGMGRSALIIVWLVWSE